MPRRVLVLNATYEPINVCRVKRAVVLLLRGKAEMVEARSGRIHSEKLALLEPSVIRLRYYVKVPRGERRRISRRAVLARDRFHCQYCGSSRHLTLDHVVPRSRGGSTTWDNVVTSCAPCNVRKGSSLPFEAGMALRTKPRPPSPAEFLITSPRGVPKGWEPYLEAGAAVA